MLKDKSSIINFLDKFYEKPLFQIIFTMAIIDSLSIFFNSQFESILNRYTVSMAKYMNIANTSDKLSDRYDILSILNFLGTDFTVYQVIQFFIRIGIYFFIACIICYVFIFIFRSKRFIRLNYIVGALLMIRYVIVHLHNYPLHSVGTLIMTFIAIIFITYESIERIIDRYNLKKDKERKNKIQENRYRP